MTDNRLRNIWDTFHDRLENYIRQKVNDPFQAEDILQDVFLKIHDSIEKLNDENKLEPWLFKIAKFTIIDFYRSRKPVPLPAAAASKSRMEEDLHVSRGVQAVSEIINTLPEKYAPIVRMFKIEKMTAKEISGKTGLSVSSVKSRLFRGNAMLSEKLKTCCDIHYDRDGNICDINCTDKFKKITRNARK